VVTTTILLHSTAVRPPRPFDDLIYDRAAALQLKQINRLGERDWLAGYVTVTLMTFGKHSMAVERPSNRNQIEAES